jgi:hypothetical protein
VQQDINWMLNSRQFLNPEGFEYLYEEDEFTEELKDLSAQRESSSS